MTLTSLLRAGIELTPEASTRRFELRMTPRVGQPEIEHSRGVLG